MADDNAKDCNVRVICRFRPDSEYQSKTQDQKTAAGFKLVINPDGKSLTIKPPAGQLAKTAYDFKFDRVYDGTSKQIEVFQECVETTVHDILKGYNGTIFAFGQTGSGKTFTMFGAPSVELAGVIPRVAKSLFESLEVAPDIEEATVKCSFLEIYKEVVRDLLDPANTDIKIRESPNGDTYVNGLTDEYASDANDVLSIISMGEKNRSTSKTDMNEVSSRSHSVFSIIVTQKLRDGTTRTGKFNLADLAGSERIEKTNATGTTLEEAKKINQSLSALGNCINALTDMKRTHVPFRDSTLTFLLKDSLGGNCKTTLLVNCSPEAFNCLETISTLKFAQRAKSIKNNARVNKVRSVEELELLIVKLRKELDASKKRVKELESLCKHKGIDPKQLAPKEGKDEKSSSKGGKRSSKVGISAVEEEDGEQDVDDEGERSMQVGGEEVGGDEGREDELAAQQTLAENTLQELADLRMEMELLEETNEMLQHQCKQSRQAMTDMKERQLNESNVSETSTFCDNCRSPISPIPASSSSSTTTETGQRRASQIKNENIMAFSLDLNESFNESDTEKSSPLNLTRDDLLEKEEVGEEPSSAAQRVDKKKLQEEKDIASLKQHLKDSSTGQHDIAGVAGDAYSPPPKTAAEEAMYGAMDRDDLVERNRRLEFKLRNLTDTWAKYLELVMENQANHQEDRDFYSHPATAPRQQPRIVKPVRTRGPSQTGKDNGGGGLLNSIRRMTGMVGSPTSPALPTAAPRPAMMGMMEKRPYGFAWSKAWKNRFFVLQGKQLSYYLSSVDFENGGSPRDVIDISCINTVLEIVPKTTEFNVIVDGATYSYKCSNEKEQQQWTSALQSCIDRQLKGVYSQNE